MKSENIIVALNILQYRWSLVIKYYWQFNLFDNKIQARPVLCPYHSPLTIACAGRRKVFVCMSQPFFPETTAEQLWLSRQIMSGWHQSCSLSSSFSSSLSSSPCQERKSWSTPSRMSLGYRSLNQGEYFNSSRRNDWTNCWTLPTLLLSFGTPGTVRGVKMCSSVNKLIKWRDNL